MARTRTRQERLAAPAGQDDALARVLADLEARVEELADAGARELLDEIPAYQAQADPEFRKDVRGHVLLHYQTVIDSFSAQRPVAREDLLFIRSYAARRMDRISIADFIHAFHAAQHVLWNAVVALAIDDESRKAVLGLVTKIARYFDVATTHAAEVYVEAQELHAAAAERVRRDLLEDLLAGKAPAPGPRLDALRAAGLDLAGACLVIVAVPTVALDDDNALRGSAAALARATRRAVQPLTVVRSGEIVVVTPAPAGGPAALAKRVEDAQRRLAERHVPLAVGMSTVHDRLEGVASAYREAVSARDRLLPNAGVVALPVMTTFDYLTVYTDGTAQRLIPPAIERFVREDLERGGTLVATLCEYAAADLNAKLAAERLHIHVNTAHYRLARIAERTGCDLRRVSDVIELLIASRLAGKA
jgi:sugar diacid utilization regulator